MIRLHPRLEAAASLVQGGGKLADIGSDHAYLPVFLVQQGRVPYAIASDIGAGPLKNAEKTVKRYSLQNEIELRLSDGLANISPEEVDEIVICGMGGDLIARIFTDAPWVKRQKQHLVLQPMSHAQDVRRYLCENGFSIEKELCVKDDGRVYLTLSAVYTGNNNSQSVGYYYFGNLIEASGAAQDIVRKQLKWVHTRLDAITAAHRFPEEQEELLAVLHYYEEVNSK